MIYSIYMEMMRMKKIYNNAGSRIRYLREERHYTREQLSEMADISPKFLYEIENGQKGFSADTLYKLAEALETNADYILGGKSRRESEDEILQLCEYFDDKQRKSITEILQLVYKIMN